jgi:hypothetical protein
MEFTKRRPIPRILGMVFPPLYMVGRCSTQPCLVDSGDELIRGVGVHAEFDAASLMELQKIH